VSVINTRNKAHWAESNSQFIWAARSFAGKTNAAVPLECGKQGTVSYDRRRSAERLKFFDNSGNSIKEGALKT